MFAQIYQTTPNWIHFKPLHWSKDFNKLFRQKDLGQVKATLKDFAELLRLTFGQIKAPFNVILVGCVNGILSDINNILHKLSTKMYSNNM